MSIEFLLVLYLKRMPFLTPDARLWQKDEIRYSFHV